MGWRDSAIGKVEMGGFCVGGWVGVRFWPVVRGLFEQDAVRKLDAVRVVSRV